MNWRRALAPPQFATELETVQTYLILFSAGILLVGLVIAISLAVLGDYALRPLIPAQLVSMVIHIFCIIQLYRRRLRQASILLLMNGMCVTFTLLITANGLFDVAIWILPILLLVGGFILSNRDYLLFAALLVAGVVVVGTLQLNGWYDNEIGRAHQAEAPFDFAITLMLAVITVVIVRIFTSQLAKQLKRAQLGELALREANLELDQRVNERTAELATSNRELAGMNRELETFARSLSHDLRTPLRAVGGYSRILLEDHGANLGEEERNLIQRMENAAIRLSKMSDKLLEFFRLSDKSLDPHWTHIEQLCLRLITAFQPALGDRQVQWQVGSLPSASVDLMLMRQVFHELISNALKFTSMRDDPVIEIGSTLVDAQTAYFVRDNGVGFDSAYADKLFTVFQRLHGEMEFSGMGVGLAVVQRIITRHGGRVWAESQQGNGATFYFSLDAKCMQAHDT